MRQIYALIDALRSRSDLGVINQAGSYLILITKGPDLLCEVTVPFDALEWFVCVKSRRDQKEVWSDWMDYAGYGDQPVELLEADMAADILDFVNRASIAQAPFPSSIYGQRG